MKAGCINLFSMECYFTKSKTHLQFAKPMRTMMNIYDNIISIPNHHIIITYNELML